MSRQLFHIFPSLGVGGSQVRLAQIGNHFGQRYEHTIFATDGNYDALSMWKPDVLVRKYEAKIDKRRGLRNIHRYRRIVREARADIVVTHNWGAIEWAFATRLVRGQSHVHIEDGFGPDEANRQLARRIFFRRLALGGRSTTVVVPSHALYSIATRIWKLPAAKVQLIPNGIDLQRFARADTSQAWQLAQKMEGEVLIGTVASLRPEKNLALLLEAFSRLPSIPLSRLFIVGSGSELPHLKRTAHALGVGDRVVFFGHTPTPECVMRAFDIFAMSSSTEQMPIGLLEAMACALPAAATDVGDIALMLSPENRDYVTLAGSVEALSGALRRLVEDRSLRLHVGARNLARATAEYDQVLMFARYAQLFG